MNEHDRNSQPCRIAQEIDSYKDLLHDEPDRLFCECNLVSVSEIKAELDELEDFQALLHKLCVGSGCGSCMKNVDINELYKKLKG